jgi:hypothetical protein
MLFSFEFFWIANVVFHPLKVNPKGVLKKSGSFIFRRPLHQEITLSHSVNFCPKKDNWRKVASNNAAAENEFRTKQHWYRSPKTTLVPRQ